MKLLLIGYGKMGKTIHHLVNTQFPNHKIVGMVTAKDKDLWHTNIADQPDVAIEFTHPDQVVSNIEKCVAHDIPLVIGTTGWYDKFEDMKKLVIDSNQAMFYATNFSVGVNIFFELNKYLAMMMNKLGADYRPTITEIHHLTKKDAPSGTAITLAEGILQAFPKYNSWINQPTETENLLPILSRREADVKGTHIVQWDAPIDAIHITHEAHSRDGFALGAIKAAEWLIDKKGVYTMSDLLKI